MAVTKITARQFPVDAFIDVGVANIGDGNGASFRVPHGAYVTGVFAYCATAFDTGGNTPVATITVSDGTTTFVSAQDVLTPGAITVAVSAKYYPTGGTITVSLAQSAASALEPATTGEAVVVVQYAERGRWSENQG